MKFYTGQKVLVKKPKNTNEYPCWLLSMNEYNEKILTISRIDNNCIYFKEALGYSFSYKWITPIKCINE
jgi:hypothetical protein